jgi:hypothetical protein
MIGRIKKFSEFIFESVSYGPKMELPDTVIDYILGLTNKRMLGQLSGDSNLKRMYLDDPDNSGTKRIYVSWGNIIFRLPAIGYNESTDEVAKIGDELPSVDSFFRELRDKGIIGYKDNEYSIDPWTPENSKYSNMLYILFKGLIDVSRKESSFLNPFTDLDIYSNQAFNSLIKMKTSIVSSDLQKKNGTLVLQNPYWDSQIGIYNNGYIRKLSGSRPASMVSNPELIAPIYSEEDLNIKLEYLRWYTIKKILMEEDGLKQKDIKKLREDLVDNPSEYARRVKELVYNNPKLSLYLPAPEGGFDSGIAKGARILNRLGIY